VGTILPFNDRPSIFTVSRRFVIVFFVLYSIQDLGFPESLTGKLDEETGPCVRVSVLISLQMAKRTTHDTKQRPDPDEVDHRCSYQKGSRIEKGSGPYGLCKRLRRLRACR
jgi:hypothetical protein